MIHTKKTIATILIALTLISPLHYTDAIWSNVVSDFGVASYKQMLSEIREQIVKAIEASAKMMAIKQATSMIETLLYGGNSSPRNINNFQDFLINDPHDVTIAYAQDFLTNSLRGSTSGDYTPAGGSSDTGLSDAIKAAGESVIQQWQGKTPNYDSYRDVCSDSSNYFADGNFECYDAIINNAMPFKMALDMDSYMTNIYQQEQLKQQVRATSSGVLDQVDEKGNVVLPSSVVEALQLQRITLPLEALANGDSGAFSSLIQSFAVSLIVGVAERGLGEVEQSVDENINAFERQYTEEMGQYYNKVGPALNYANNAYDAAKKYEQTDADSSDTEDTYDTENNTNTPEADSIDENRAGNGGAGLEYGNAPANDVFTNPTTGKVTRGGGAADAYMHWSESTAGRDYFDNQAHGTQ